MAMHARPVPLDPYSPIPPASQSISVHSSTTSNEEETVRHPSPFVPIRLPIFGIVIWLNDLIVRIISVGGGRGARSGGKTRPIGRARAMSDGVENAEEGIELDAFGKRGGTGSRKVD